MNHDVRSNSKAAKMTQIYPVPETNAKATYHLHIEMLQV